MIDQYKSNIMKLLILYILFLFIPCNYKVQGAKPKQQVNNINKEPYVIVPSNILITIES